jgi:hypothetical protein
MVKRAEEEWVLLPEGTAPALIDKETFARIQEQFTINREDALRNNNHKEELGLLRAGYISCGVCGRRMQVAYPGTAARENGCTPCYLCRQKSKGALGSVYNHRTQIHVPTVDQAAYEKIMTIVNNPSWVRAKIAELRAKPKPPISKEDVEATIEKITKSLQNLYTLAEDAPDDEELARIRLRMQELGKQKREAEGKLFDLADKEEEQAALEAEIVKFEKWADDVREDFNDPNYTPTYNDLRLAVRILGIKAIVYPTIGDWPFRQDIVVTVPEIMKRVHSVAIDPSISSPFAPL